MTTDPDLLAALTRAEDLLGFHERSAKPNVEGGHPVVWINGEDFDAILRDVRAAITAARAEQPEPSRPCYEPEKMRWTLESSGWVPCDIPACNCNGWHQVGGFRARFDEIADELSDAGYDQNGRTALTALRDLIAERDALRQRAEQPAQGDGGA